MGYSQVRPQVARAASARANIQRLTLELLSEKLFSLWGYRLTSF
jgi:hypothetical protein